jgi:hypothetical protein
MHAVLFDLIKKANKNEEYYSLGGPYDPDDGVVPPLAKLEEELQEALERVQFLRKHVHEWDDDSYCIHCGADGRA